MKHIAVSMDCTFPVLCGLLGEKPSKLSQAMHNAGFQAAGLSFVYVAFNTSDTSAAFSAAKTLGIRGLSLTIPHKESALAFIDELSEQATAIGAANTVIFDHGKVYGFNSDWIGIRDAFAEAGVSVAGKRALIFGAGGASRAAIYCMQQLQAAEVVVVNRSDARAEEVAKFSGASCESYSKCDAAMVSGFDIFINCTPIGSKLDPHGVYPFDCGCFNSSHVVFDMVTNQTPLLLKAQQQGATAIAGERMLLFQALVQFKLFTNGVEPPKAEMEEALQTALALHQYG